MGELHDKIFSLINMLKGSYSLDFLQAAFADEQKGDIAIAVVELCCAGKLVITEEGIGTPMASQPPAPAAEEEATPAAAAEDEVASATAAEGEATPAAAAEGEAASATAAAIASVAEPQPVLELEPEAASAVDSMAVPSHEHVPASEPATSVPEFELIGTEPVASVPEPELELIGTEPVASVPEPELELIGTEPEPVYSSDDYLSEDEIQGLIDNLSAPSYERYEFTPRPKKEPVKVAPVVDRILLATDFCDALPFKNRALNCFGREGIVTIGDLAARFDSLENMGHMGAGTLRQVDELLSCGAVHNREYSRETWLALQKKFSSKYVFDEFGQLVAVPKSAMAGYPDAFDEGAYFASFAPGANEVVKAAWDICKRGSYNCLGASFFIILPARAQALLAKNDGSVPAASEALAIELAQDPNMIERCTSILSSRFAQADASSIEGGRFIDIPQGECWDTAVKQLLDAQPRAQYNEAERRVTVSPIRLSEWLEPLQGNSFDIMRSRLEGKKLQEVGDEFGITRERARQLQEKALESRPVLYEDKYLPIFDKYKFGCAQFCKAYQEPEQVYYYLKMVSTAKGKDRMPLSEAANDPFVPQEVKALAEAGMVEGSICVDGEWVKKSERPIIDFLVKKHASSQNVSLDELYSLYQDFLRDHNLQGEKPLDPSNMRAFGATVERCEKVLNARVLTDDSGLRNGIRYYDSSAFDLDALAEAIGALAGKNIECSAELLMGLPELAEVLDACDIRNGYELHWVVKNRCGAIEGVELGRCPMITLGSANRRKQVADLIQEIGPASADALAKEYELRYGITQATFRANYLDEFDNYCSNGLYSIKAITLNDAQINFLQDALVGEAPYCEAAEIEKLFTEQFPEWDGTLLTNAVFNQLGFRVSGGLLVANWVNESDLFASLIKSLPRFTAGKAPFTASVCDNRFFKSELDKVLRAWEVVQVRKEEYWAVGEIKGDGNVLTPQHCEAFVNRCLEAMEPEIPYTIPSLRKLGLTSEIDAIVQGAGLGDYVLQSILTQAYVGGALKRTNIANMAVFCKTRGTFKATAMLETLIAQNGSMSVNELVALLKSQLGLQMVAAQLRIVIQRSDRLQVDPSTSLVSL